MTTLLAILCIACQAPADPSGVWATESGWLLIVSKDGEAWKTEWWHIGGSVVAHPGKPCCEGRMRRIGLRQFSEKVDGIASPYGWCIGMDDVLRMDARGWQPMYRPRKR